MEDRTIMRDIVLRFRFVALTAATAVLCGGCDGGGVYDIVWGALQLAFGIVDVAT